MPYSTSGSASPTAQERKKKASRPPAAAKAEDPSLEPIPEPSKNSVKGKRQAGGWAGSASAPEIEGGAESASAPKIGGGASGGSGVATEGQSAQHCKAGRSQRPQRQRRPSRTLPSTGQIFFFLMSTFCFVLLFRNSDAAIEYIGQGLALCVHTVIPSLFPFMVLSELLVASGAGEALGRIFARPMRWFFGLSGAGASAVVLGSMCGFPVGAKTAVSLYDRNMISKAECEHLLTFSNNPSSAFLITAVGVSLFGNRRLGLVLYGVVLGASFIVGFLGRFFFREREGVTISTRHSHPHFPSGLHPGGVGMFTGAVSGAANGMLMVCAYVVFFSAMRGALSCMIRELGGMNEVLYALFCGLLELSSGVSQTAALRPLVLATVFTAAVAGWSGLSVHCQIMTLCGGRGLSLKPYIIAKAVQGLLCAALMGLLWMVMDPTRLLPQGGSMVDTVITLGAAFKDPDIPAVLSNGGFLLGWIVTAGRRLGLSRKG